MRAWLSALTIVCLGGAFATLGVHSARAAEVVRLQEANWDGTVPQGKEVDAIYGDWVLRNRHPTAVIGEAVDAGHAGTAKLVFRGPATDDRTTAELIYELEDDAPWLKITTRVTNNSQQPVELSKLDAIRADGEFAFGEDADAGLLWADDA